MKILSKNLILVLSIVTGLVDAQRPLFEAFPALRDAIAHKELRELPTPIKHLSQLGELLNTHSLYIKCDNVIGGNKIRKLEFLLADALQHDAKTVLTFGCVGSNHVLATVICAQELGLKSSASFCRNPIVIRCGKILCSITRMVRTCILHIPMRSALKMHKQSALHIKSKKG